MSESQRETLLGYLSGALDEDERQKVQRELERNESFRLEFIALRKKIRPLAQYAQWTELACEPPQGLAKRTCQHIWSEVDGRRQAADGRLEGDMSTPSIPSKRNSFRLDREFHRNTSKRREWKPADILSTVCLGIMILLLIIPTFSFVKNQIVQAVRQKTVKKIANNTAVISQIHEGYFFHNEMENSGNSIAASIGGTDLGSFLASFGETNLSQKTLNFFSPNQKESGQFTVSPQSSVPTLFSRFPVNPGQSPASPQYAQSFALPVHVPSVFPLLFTPLATVFTRSPEEMAGLTFFEWDGISAPVFVEADGERPNETLMRANDEQNLIYRDGRIFFRKVLGVQALGVQALGVQALGVQTQGMQP